MRAYFVFAALAGLFGAGGYLAVKRGHTPHQAPLPPPPPPPPDAAPPAPDWSKIDAGVVREDDGGYDAGAPGRLGRPARLAMLELDAGADAERPELEVRLRKGGGDPAGADVAVGSVASFLGMSDRLAELDPVIVLATPSGPRNEVLLGMNGATLAVAGPEVRLVVDGGSDVALFALLMLDAAGYPPARVRVVPQPLADDRKPWFLAVSQAPQPAPAGARVLAGGSEIARALPTVAFAARAFVEAHPDDVRDALEPLGAGAGEGGADAGPATFDSLLDHERALWRAAGTSRTDAGAAPAVTRRVVASFPWERAAPAAAHRGNVRLSRKVVLGDAGVAEADLVELGAWLSRLFDPSVVRITASKANVKRLHAAMAERAGLGADHFGEAAGGAANTVVLDVLAAP